MKRILILIFSLLLTVFSYTQSVGIGNSSPDSKSILDISSTDKGVLIPRMLSSERSDISTPIPAGLMVYQTNDVEGFYYYDGFNWAMIGKGGNFWTKDVNGIYTMGNNVGIGTTIPNAPLSIETGTEATLSDGSGYVLIGNKDGQNLILDNNEIQARNDGMAADLKFQENGGKIGIGKEPTALLHLKGLDGTNNRHIRLESNSSTNNTSIYAGTNFVVENSSEFGDFIFKNGATGENVFNVSPEGNVNTAGSLDVAGGIKMDGEFIYDGYTINLSDQTPNPYTVGTSNVSYIRFFIGSLGGNNTIINFTNGISIGQILIISVGNSFNVNIDAPINGNVNLSGNSTNWVMNYQDTLILLWDGIRWIEITRSDN